jgi:hypothetical protein
MFHKPPAMLHKPDDPLRQEAVAQAEVARSHPISRTALEMNMRVPEKFLTD